MDERKTMFSGIQPSGDLTLGSYMGAIRNWVDMIDDYNAYYCIVDMHAITVRQVPADLRRRYAGDSSRSTSPAAWTRTRSRSCTARATCPRTAELGWVLNCFTYMRRAVSRMTQFKDKCAEARRQYKRRACLTYPVLMAADILLYQSGLCPRRGRTRSSTWSSARDIAIRFNNIYGDVFTVPDRLHSARRARAS